MCLIALSVEKNKDWSGKDSYFYKIIANRDEYHERPTSEMKWWSNNIVLAGRDEEAGGTWLGVSKEGKFGAITNLKEETDIKYSNSRGSLVTEFLESQLSAKSYLEALEPNKENYAGFNLIIGDKSGLFYLCNRLEGIFFISEGIHALGNLTLNSSTKKIESIKNDFNQILHEGFAIDKGLHIMRKEYGNLHEKTKKELQVRDGEEIPFRFIRSPIYGTRCTTVFMSEPSGLINISELTYQKEGIEGTRVDFSFSVKD
tara:strand:+ start:563 stop:1336 length:774 start_codon:yes stop_codon:yes gene_type:complete